MEQKPKKKIRNLKTIVISLNLEDFDPEPIIKKSVLRAVSIRKVLFWLLEDRIHKEETLNYLMMNIEKY